MYVSVLGFKVFTIRGSAIYIYALPHIVNFKLCLRDTKLASV